MLEATFQNYRLGSYSGLGISRRNITLKRYVTCKKVGTEV